MTAHNLKLYSPVNGDGDDGREPAEPKRSEPATVADVIRLYLDNESTRQKPETLQERCRVLDLFKEQFGRVPVSGIRKADVVLWVNAHPDWRSDWTIKRIYATIHRPFGWARKIDLIEKNPMEGLSHPRGERGKPLSDEHYQTMLRCTSALFRKVILFLRFTGARPCEMAALKWEFIDFAKGIAVLWVHKNTRRQKVKKPRVIVLLPVLLAMLKRMQRTSKSEYVFVNARGRQWNKNSLGLRIYRLRDKAGLPKAAKLYGLRHQYGTQAVEAGVPIKAVAELMGHSDSRTTEENYVHVDGNVKFLQENAANVFKKRDQQH